MFLFKVVLDISRHESKVRPSEPLIWNAQTPSYRTLSSIATDDLVRHNKFFAVRGRHEGRNLVFGLFNADEFMIEIYLDVWIFVDMVEYDSGEIVLPEENDLY